MSLDRRRALGVIGGAAAAAMLASRPAEALSAPRTTSILLYNRSTGAWLVQSPDSVGLPGTRYTGTNPARFAGRTSAVGVLRRFTPPGTANTIYNYGVLTLRGSSTVTPSWEVSAFTGDWTRRAGGNLALNGAPWIPSGWLLDPDNQNLTMIGAQQSVRMSLSMTSSANTSWSLRTLGVQRIVQPVDTDFAMAAQGLTYGMATGATLAQFYDANATPGRAPRFQVDTRIATIRGHVYGPVYTTGGPVLLVYDRASGAAQFVALGAGGSLTTARIVLSGVIASGWTHIVPFRYGWYFYHRTRRCAQLGTVAPQLYPSGVRWILRNGYLWPDGTMPDFTDAVGFA